MTHRNDRPGISVLPIGNKSYNSTAARLEAAGIITHEIAAQFQRRRGPAPSHIYWNSRADFIATMVQLYKKLENIGAPFTQPEIAAYLNRHGTVNNQPRIGEIFPNHLHRWCGWAGFPDWASLVSEVETRLTR